LPPGLRDGSGGAGTSAAGVGAERPGRNAGAAAAVVDVAALAATADCWRSCCRLWGAGCWRAAWFGGGAAAVAMRGRGVRCRREAWRDYRVAVGYPVGRRLVRWGGRPGGCRSRWRPARCGSGACGGDELPRCA